MQINRDKNLSKLFKVKFGDEKFLTVNSKPQTFKR